MSGHLSSVGGSVCESCAIFRGAALSEEESHNNELEGVGGGGAFKASSTFCLLSAF